MNNAREIAMAALFMALAITAGIVLAKLAHGFFTGSAPAATAAANVPNL
jgi:hypothetical protein